MRGQIGGHWEKGSRLYLQHHLPENYGSDATWYGISLSHLGSVVLALFPTNRFLMPWDIGATEKIIANI